MRAVLVGLGVVGTRVAHGLVGAEGLASLVVVVRDPRKAAATLNEIAGGIEIRKGGVDDLPPADVTIVAASQGVRRVAQAALAGGSHVVCISDDPSDVRGLLALDRLARAQERTVVIGAAMAPGLSCVLAAYLRRDFDTVDELHVASAGTGGPACARRHHAALAAIAVDWEDGEWRRRSGGSGRELVWFPGQPSADCYRANRPDAELLLPALPGLRRVTSRAAASRRDRTTSWLPMLRRPHPEGTVGAVRVEVRGTLHGAARSVVLGAGGRPAVLAGAVAAVAALRAARGELSSGAGGLASLIGYPGEMLAELSDRGIAVMKFEGDQPVPSW